MLDATPDQELVITRIFDAPRALVHQAFVDPDQLAQWFGPVGFSVPRDTVDIDVRAGGHQRFVMVSDEDPAMRSPVNATFTEVVENELLAGEEVYEGVAIRLRLEFHDDGGGKTRLVLRQSGFTPEVAEQTRLGWLSSFTRLDVVLAG